MSAHKYPHNLEVGDHNDVPAWLTGSVSAPSVASDGHNGSHEVHGAPDDTRDVVGQLRAENARLAAELEKLQRAYGELWSKYRGWS